MIPNIPMPTMNIKSAAELKTRFLNRERGMMGSAALSSTGMKAANRMPEITNPVTTRVAPQS
jgi:hypothetical protein